MLGFLRRAALNSDDISKKLLEELGFSVTKIPEKNDRKEADFLAKFGGDNFLIEAKVKSDSENEINKKEDTLSRGDVFISEGSLGRNETISTIIRHASKQLRSSSSFHDHNYKLVFIFCVDINTKTKSDKVIDTLYGRTQIIEMNKSNPVLKPCYFFRHADLYRRKDDIDGVVIGYEDPQGRANFQLCLNTYSDNYSTIKDSLLVSKFGAALVDPISEEENQKAYIPDINIPRSKPNESYLTPLYNPMLHHLKEKYGTEFLMNVDFDSPEFSIRDCGD